MIFAIVRLGTQIALPGIDTAGVIAARENASMAGTLYSNYFDGKIPTRVLLNENEKPR